MASKMNGQRMTAAERNQRQQHALELWETGHTYAEIGHQLDITESAANKLVRRALKAAVPDVELERARIIRTRDRVVRRLMACMDSAENTGDIVRVSNALGAWCDRSVKLFGLDAARGDAGSHDDLHTQLQELAAAEKQLREDLDLNDSDGFMIDLPDCMQHRPG